MNGHDKSMDDSNMDTNGDDGDGIKNNDGEDEELYLDQEDAVEVVDDNDIETDEPFEDEEIISEEASTSVVDMAKLAVDLHDKGVFAIASSGSLAASGGEDDLAIVWDISTGKTLFKCDGHSDSVVQVAFNSKGNLLATGDMSGKIQIWNVDTGSRVITYADVSELEWLEWHHSADILLAGAKDGLIWMWLVPKTECKLFSAEGLPCLAGKLLPDGKRLVAAYENGIVRLWNLKDSINTVVSGLAREVLGTVLTVDVHSNQSLGACGTETGTVALFHTENAKFTSVFQVPPVDADCSNSIETVAFSPDQPLLASGSVQGRLNVWDLNSESSRVDVPHPNGIVKIKWLDSFRFVTACLDGVLRLIDSRSGEIQKTFTGHISEILDFCVSGDKSLLLTASDDTTCRIFELKT